MSLLSVKVFVVVLEKDGESHMILTEAKLVICEVKGLNPILAYVQEDVFSQKYGLIRTGIGVANGCLEELKGIIFASVILVICKNNEMLIGL